MAIQASAEYRALAVLNFVNVRSPIKRGWPDGHSCCGDRVALLTFPNDLLVSI